MNGSRPRPTLLTVKRCDLAIEPVRVHALGKLDELVPHVDDLIEPRRNRLAAPVGTRPSAESPPPLLHHGEGITTIDLY